MSATESSARTNLKPISPVIPGTPFQEVVFAKDQPEYLPLPAVLADNGTRVITCWRLSFLERVRVLFSGRIWLSMLTFGKPLQPVLPETESPKRYLEAVPERKSLRERLCQG